jgi:hypothetical protein
MADNMHMTDLRRLAPSDRSDDRRHRGVLSVPIEDIATGMAPPTRTDAWTTSAEVASLFLRPHTDPDRRLLGRALLDLAYWCRTIDTPPLLLRPSQLGDYLRAAESHAGLSQAVLHQRMRDLLGYFDFAVSERFIDCSPLPNSNFVLPSGPVAEHLR